MASSVTYNVSKAIASSNYTLSETKVITDWIVLLLYFITSIIAIAGNIFVCLVIYNKKHLRSTTYILILNMAISDIIAGAMIPLNWLFCSSWLLDYGWSQRICNTQKVIQLLTYYVSAYSMAAIAIDRYRLVCRPLSGKMGHKWPIIIIWSLGFIFVFPIFFRVRVVEFFTPDKGIISCRILFHSKIGLILTKARSYYQILAQYILPLLLTAVLYGKVAHTIWRRKEVASKTHSKKIEINKNKRKTIKMLIIVTTLFALVFMPIRVYRFMRFISAVVTTAPDGCVASALTTFLYWLGESSCTYNPFIYCYFNIDFRNEAIRYINILLPCYKVKNNNVEIESDKTASELVSNSV